MYMSPAAKRDIQLKIMVSADERRMLDELAERSGLTASDVIRQFIRREHAATSPATTTRKPKKK